MVPMREFVGSLNGKTECLAGAVGLDNLCRDILLLNDEKVWLRSTQNSEFQDTLVFVKADLFPAYSSTFDLLLRFFQQARVAGVLFQGGAPSDFSKATLMLADILGIPILWTHSSLYYSTVARHFYTLVTQRTQAVRHQLSGVRKRLEFVFYDPRTLADWLRVMERELFVQAEVRMCDVSGDYSLRTQWKNVRGREILLIPIRVLDRAFLLQLTPNDVCPLFSDEHKALWIEELAGVLRSQTAYFLLTGLPGITTQSQWYFSFEQMVYNKMSKLSVFNTGANQADLGGVRLAQQEFELSRDSLVRMVDLRPIQSVELLWLYDGDAKHDVQRPLQRQADLPYAYRRFSSSVLSLRERLLVLCAQSRFAAARQTRLTACVPWQDWRNHQGIALFSFGMWNADKREIERLVRDWLAPLQIQVGTSLRAYFCQQRVDDVTDGDELLQVALALAAKSYPDFLGVMAQPAAIQFADSSRDVVNRLLPTPDKDSSYFHAEQMLSPLLADKGGEPLLEALEAYLECGAKMQVAAEKLYLHRNTLRYRLKRVEQLLHIQLDDDQIRFTYQLAIRTWRLRNPRTPA
ncbi:hypothetical protein AAC03nite_23700 [Alicyclobacillus acidoterrestris]|nr:hypothetical protein AAC03nite_23700 [Alicyclobacillus acidoterrestris]